MFPLTNINADTGIRDNIIALRGNVGANRGRNMNLNRSNLNGQNFQNFNRTGSIGAYGHGDVPLNTFNNGVPVYNPYVYSTANPYVVYPYPYPSNTNVIVPQSTAAAVQK